MTQTHGPAPCWLEPDDPELWFPDVELALQEPDGLLAVGGDLSEDRLLLAYRSGIFPWYGPGQPILWWSPDPRLVLFPDRLRVARSLAKTIRKAAFSITIDQAFDAVINACAEPRPGQAGTWIIPEMMAAYRAACGGLCTLGRVLAGRQAGRWSLRRSDRAHFFW
jgi:leucyl/phenylalanyl-tRNA--protein transferase